MVILDIFFKVYDTTEPFDNLRKFSIVFGRFWPFSIIFLRFTTNEEASNNF